MTIKGIQTKATFNIPQESKANDPIWRHRYRNSYASRKDKCRAFKVGIEEHSYPILLAKFV